jgi:peptidoglycan/LPS O-acetylase OafA/YrhL
MTNDMARVNKLTLSESLTLDIVRICAAMLVAVGHLTLPCFSTGLPNLVRVGREAVAVFFVLSGFVIRYVTVSRPGTMGSYFKDRAARIYSVAIPAMILTIVVDSISMRVNPVFYTDWATTLPRAIYGIIGNLIFTAQFWGQYFDPLSNSPFWSLNYEVTYYILYGCAYYLRGAKRFIWIAIICIIVGPRTLLLFPTWLLGCYAYDLYERWHSSRKAAHYLSLATAVVVLIGVVVVIDRNLARAILDFYDVLAHEGKVFSLGRSSGVIDFYAIGLAGTVVLLRVLLTIRNIQLDAKAIFVRTVRYLSEGTFAIYLIHFPLFVLAGACIPYNHGSTAEKAAILLVVTSMGVLLGQVCNAFKVKLRSGSLLRS